MKKSLISLTLITCLVLPGFLGSVYGQIETLMPDRFLNQDLLGLNIELNNGNNSEYQNDYYFIANQDQSINCESKIFSGHLLSSDSVLMLRNQLIDHFEKGEIEEVKKIKNILWEGQKVKGENLSYPEYWLILFWTKEYDPLLDLKQQVREYSWGTGTVSVYTTITVIKSKLKYESFYPILQENSHKLHGLLKDNIRMATTCEERIFLINLLRALIKSNFHPSDLFAHDDSTNFRINRSLRANAEPSNVGFGVSTSYQKAWYGGEISNYVHEHTNYKVLPFDFYYKRYYFKFIAFTTGKFEAGYLSINGDIFNQKFYGIEFEEFGCIVGYELVSHPRISIIPNIGYSDHSYVFSTTNVTRGINKYSPGIKVIDITNYSLGLIADFKLVKIDECKNSYIALRFQYDYYFTGNRYELYNGNFHQFAIGLVFTVPDI